MRMEMYVLGKSKSRYVFLTFDSGGCGSINISRTFIAVSEGIDVHLRRTVCSKLLYMLHPQSQPSAY